MQRTLLTVLIAIASFVAMPELALAERVTVTVSGIYQYTGAAPSPTPNFTLSFELERSPTVCGGSPGVFLVCDASPGHYVNGPLDTMIGLSSPPSVLFADAANGGGLSFYQQDLPLNRLGFQIDSSQLFGGSVASPTLLDGVYATLPNAPCIPELGCNYVSFAGQGFAVGDPINNPFHDPVSLQSYDPIVSGTITIAAAIVPEPEAAALLLTGLALLGASARRAKG